MPEQTSTAQRALLILPDPVMADVLTKALVLAGFATVDIADSLQAGLEHLRRSASPFQLVGSGLHLPDGDGFQLIEALSAQQFSGSLLLVEDAPQTLIEAAADLAEERGLRIAGSFESPFSVSALLQTLGENQLSIHRAAVPGLAYRPSEEELQQACDAGEIEALFQPKLSVRDGGFAGFEALARWNHPEHGQLPPASFIACAEAGSAIHRLTEIITAQALEALKRCRVLAPRACAAVNLSGSSLGRDDLPERCMEIVSGSGLPHSAVIFEVTETQMLLDINHAMTNINRLRLMGFGLALDDYGTGFSSLTRLKALPFNELKVDRRFVHRASTRTSTRHILNNCLELGRTLGLQVVAEGVEQQRDLDLVRELGFDYVQGYFLSPPLTAGRLQDWLEAREE